MESLVFLLIGIFIGLILLVIKRSIYMPRPRTVQAIMLFGRLFDIISNIEGKTLYKGNDNHYHKKWDLIDSILPEEKNVFSNIHFFLWPLFKVYKFPLTYTKVVAKGNERPDDKIIWQEESSKDIVIARKGISDHLEFRVEYPTITKDLNSKELASFDIYSNNIIELTNPSLVLFSIKNWMNSAMEILHGALRTLVAERKVRKLNLLSSADTYSNFDLSMKEIADTGTVEHPGLGNIGLKLFKSVFKNFNPADEKSKKLLDSFANVKIAEERGTADLKLAEKMAKVNIATAKGTAKSLAINQEAIIQWRKKYLVNTGLAKINGDGEIVELIPDANVRVGVEALAALKNLTGTLVVNSEGLNKVLNLNNPFKLNSDV